MKKRFLSMMLAMAMVFAVPIVSNAEEITETPVVDVENAEGSFEEMSEENAESVEQTSARTSRSKTVTDSHGNRYTVTGTTLRSGTIATTATAFKTSYYYTGQNANVVSGYRKVCQANLSVNLQGGGANSHNKSQTLTGTSGECKDSQSYYYTVTYAVGNHYFGCEGGSASFQSAD